MIQIFGNFIEQQNDSQEYLILGFSPSSSSLKNRWQNNGLSADFMADYLANFFPCKDNSNILEKHIEIKNAVGYIANELLENAMKFNHEESPMPTVIRLHLNDDRIVFLITNSIHPRSVDKFQAYIKELTSSDPGELYIRKLESNAETGIGSGIGLLTMLHDYDAQLGWKFETSQQGPQTITVTTMVQLKI